MFSSKSPRKSGWKHGARNTTIGLGLLVALVGAWASSARTANAPARVAPNPIPVGTVLPIRLEHTLSVDDAKAGQEIEAHITQEVPLPNHKKIPVRADVHGVVVSVEKLADGSGVDVSLRFDKVEFDKQMIPMTVSLRAMASFEAVHAAQIPKTGADGGTPSGWGDTVQIGGDIRFGDGGEVRNRQKQKVGKGVFGGVLVHVSAQPGSACEGPLNGDDQLQALWVFSADACGLYDFKDAKIISNGKADPVGVITLRFEKEKMRMDASTGILLRTVATE
jgi:hypothetical protein